MCASRSGAGTFLTMTGLLLGLLGASPAGAQFQIQSPDGSSTLKIGFLLQGRAESLEASGGSETAYNLFFRRLRLLTGGRLGERWSFFIDTDSPNLGKAEVSPLGGYRKNTGGLYLQDFTLTWQGSEALQADIGMMLLAVNRNSGQSAASLLATDYGPWTWIWSDPMDSRVGRDYGVRLHGLLAGGRLAYRAGFYQGLRGDPGYPLRLLGRVVWSFFEPEAGLFYSGANLGQHRILSLGAGVDAQKDYRAVSGDLFWDQPLGGGDALTLQIVGTRYDGGDLLGSALPEQTVWLVETGYWASGPELLPFIQYSQRDFKSAAAADETMLQAGFGWLFAGYNRNLKLSWARYSAQGSADRDQLWLNLQVFIF